MEDQGIMALPQAGMQAPTAQPQAAIDPKNFSPQVFDYARMQPDQFGQDIMGGMEAADPAMVAEFKQALAGMQLPPEVIDVLGDMVDAILADPENYEEDRASAIQAGIPEEILPPTFDAAYFAAFNIALDQLSAQQTPVGMARGGIMALSPVATELAKMGRNGDRMLAHITPSEARMLRRSGGSGTINPRTGFREYGKLKKWAKSAVKAITQPIKSTVKAVGKVVKKIAASPIGRMALTAAAVYFMGPAATQFLGGLGVTNAALVTGINTFAASTAVSLASGENLKDSLKTGVVSGVLAGVTTGVVKGFDATAPGAPVSPGPDVEVNALGETGGTTVQRLAPISDATQTVADVSATSNVVTPDTVSANALRPEMVTSGPDLTAGQNALTFEPNFRMEAGGVDLAQNAANTASDVTSGIGNVAAPNAPLNLIDHSDIYAGQSPTIEGPVTTPQSFTDMAKTAYNTVADPVKDFYGEYVRPYSPAGIREAGALEAATASNTAGQEYINNALQSTGYSSVREMPVALQSEVLRGAQLAGQSAATAATPGLFSQYAPVTGAALGAAYLGGAFTPEEPQAPGTLPKETGFDLMERQPEIYGTTPGGARTVYSSLFDSTPQAQPAYQFTPIEFQPVQYPTFQPRFAQGGIAAVAPARYNLGGYASGGIGSMAKKYPRRTGQISGPGTGTSDSIPAMLSDGEFVMTAKAVRGAGGGSRREGARKMYQMMRKFERNS
jgi:hypothetical protein